MFRNVTLKCLTEIGKIKNFIRIVFRRISYKIYDVT